jgi:NAD(P)-dependent dehydrogenase (short-subunit alcohol dehydrogenase family)
MTEVVVVTGATSGVGRATAVEFARHGARVALLGRGEEGLAAAAADVEAAGGTPLSIPTDVSDDAAVDATAARIEDELGPIDVWVSNAMTTIFAEFTDVSADEFRRATEITYLGAVWGMRAALGRMLPRDRGTIVVVGSALAYRGIPLQASYCGAKFATRGVFESLRCELRHKGSNVHLTMVQLPGLNTPQFEHCLARMPNHPRPVPPVFQPEVAARAVYWAAHHRRRELFVGGPTVKTIWGSMLVPWLVERYLARTGYDAQQLPGVPLDRNRPANLWAPVPGDPGAHGRFDDTAKSRSLQAEAAKRRAPLLAAAAAVGAAVTLRRL